MCQEVFMQDLLSNFLKSLNRNEILLTSKYIAGWQLRKASEPVRRLRNRMRPVDLNYYGGYSLDYLDGFGGAESVQEMMKKRTQIPILRPLLVFVS